MSGRLWGTIERNQNATVVTRPSVLLLLVAAVAVAVALKF